LSALWQEIAARAVRARDDGFCQTTGNWQQTTGNRQLKEDAPLIDN
jgi:hypothetical protein